MDDALSQIFRAGTIAVAVGVFVATFFIRRITELLIPSLKKSEDKYKTKLSLWWNTVILYAIPVLLGCSVGFIPSDFLHGDIKDMGGRLMFQAGVGWFSSFIYKVTRKMILQKAGVDLRRPPSGDSDG